MIKMTDRNGKNISEGDHVLYQAGTKFEAMFILKKDKRGTLRFHFPNGDGHSMEGLSRTSGWDNPSDSERSLVIFSKQDVKNEYGDRVGESGCCDGWSSSMDEIDGLCPDCGHPVVEGSSASGCHYSPEECSTCGWCPCDGSC